MKQGAQYAGFYKALPAVGESSAPGDFRDALTLFGEVLGRNLDLRPEAWTLKQLEDLWKEAAYKAHPDRGGTHDLMARVNAAITTIRTHYK